MTQSGRPTGLRASARAVVSRWRRLAVAAWDDAVRIVPALDLGAQLLTWFRRRNGSVLVGHVAYRTFMWLIPLLLAAIGLLGYGAAEGLDIVQYGREAGLDEQVLDSASEDVGPAGLWVIVVAVVGLVWTTRSLLRALFFVFAQAWDVEPRLPRRTMRAIGLTLVGALVTLAVTAAANALAGRGPLLFVGAGIAGAVGLAGLLMVVTWFLPHRASSIFELMPGTAVWVTGVVLISTFGGLYFPQRLGEASDTYGALGFTLVFLFYLWLWAFLLVASAFVNAVWCDRERILDGRPWVAAPERLPAWIRRVVPGIGERRSDEGQSVP